MNKENVVSKTEKKPFILGIIASYLVAVFPGFYIFTKNINQLDSHDLLLTLGLVTAHWLVIFIISLILMRKPNKAAFATIIAVLPLSLFQLGIKVVNRVTPLFYYWHGLIIVVFSIVLIWLLLKAFMHEKTARKLNLIFGAMVLILIVINGTGPLIKYLKEMPAKKQVTSATEINANKVSLSKDLKRLPNIYLFIFDEYSGSEGLLRYTGFDNSRFYKDLSRLGFNVSNHSVNYSSLTLKEVPNLLNLSLLAKEKSIAIKDELLKNPILFSTLREIGYEFNLINDQGLITLPESYFKYMHNPQKTFEREESLAILLFDMSVYSPLRMYKKSTNARIEQVHQMFDYAGHSSTFQESGLFTLGYFWFPHLPWVVDEHGQEIDSKERDNWMNPDAYLGQLKYTNKLILPLVQTIIKNDPESCIILMSDHGYRRVGYLVETYGNEAADMAKESYYTRNILNAVYLLGEPIDIEGYSGINTMRIILDRLFDLNLGLIEEPNKNK